jgi:ribonuclease HI
MNYVIYTDGGSRGNPGPSGAGGYIMDSNKVVIATISEFLGIQTNNYAEYKALELTLSKAIELCINKYPVQVFMDSKLVVEQLNGHWKVKNENLMKLYLVIKELIALFPNIKIDHILRKYNKEADKLANQAMDSATLLG